MSAAGVLAPLPAVAPALPLHTAGKYVAAAYVVAFAVILIYVAIMALRVRRMERSLEELSGRAGASADVSEEALAR
ncbi:MAG: hypothetical protein ACYDA6_02795 [Solirubrobacteraceae bacterium]